MAPPGVASRTPTRRSVSLAPDCFPPGTCPRCYYLCLFPPWTPASRRPAGCVPTVIGGGRTLDSLGGGEHTLSGWAGERCFGAAFRRKRQGLDVPGGAGRRHRMGTPTRVRDMCDPGELSRLRGSDFLPSRVQSQTPASGSRGQGEPEAAGERSAGRARGPRSRDRKPRANEGCGRRGAVPTPAGLAGEGPSRGTRSARPSASLCAVRPGVPAPGLGELPGGGVPGAASGRRAAPLRAGAGVRDEGRGRRAAAASPAPRPPRQPPLICTQS